jgi:hypothetical protein
VKKPRSYASVAMVLAATLLMANLAFADELNSDGDNLQAFADRNLVIAEPIRCNETATFTVPVRLKRTSSGNGNIFKNETTATIGVQSVSGMGIVATVPTSPDNGISIPAGWSAQDPGDVSSAINATVTVTPTTSGLLSGTVTFVATGTNLNNNSITRTDVLTVSGTVSSCAAATTLAVEPATGTYAGTTALSATLTADANPVSGLSVSFILNGASVGSATTDASGVASLSNIGLSGIGAGSYANGVAAVFAGTPAFIASTGSADLTVTKAATTTTISCTDAPFTYTGWAIEPCTATVTGPGGLDEPVDVTYGDNVNAGEVTADATYDGDSNYAASQASTTFEIGKATTSISLVCPGTHTYTGWAIEPCTATVTGPGGLDEPVDVTYGSNVNAGDASVNASYAGGDNYLPASNSTTFQIAKASTTTTVTCTAGPHYYSGSAITPCSASVTGANLTQSLTVSYSNNTAVGTATASATYAESANHLSSNDTETFVVSGWRTSGFYQPTDMGTNVVNTVRAGSTVPLKFEVFTGGTELTNVSAIRSFGARQMTCGSSTAEDLVEMTTTGSTVLRYDATAGQFIQNWQTPRAPAGTCYQVTVTMQDGSQITAFFKLK